MSSTGRQKKVGLQRIDAAYDALIPFGFSKEQIRSTIRNLLKSSCLSEIWDELSVYGGVSGWVFIEETGYKLVIDTILEQQEDGETENMETDEHVPDAVGETSSLPASTSNGQDHDNLAFPDQHGLNESENMQSVNKVISNRGKICKKSRVMQRSHAVNIGSSYTQQLNKEPASAVTIESSSSKKPIIGEPARKRPPCYGCFSETESDSDDEL